MSQQFMINNSFQSEFGFMPNDITNLEGNFDLLSSPNLFTETFGPGIQFTPSITPPQVSSEIDSEMARSLDSNPDLSTINWFDLFKYNDQYILPELNTTELTISPLTIGTAASASPDQDLIQTFMIYFNPYLTKRIDPKTLQRVLSSTPQLQDTFLFFSMCACASMFGNLGKSHPLATYYYSEAIELMASPFIIRDSSFQLGLHVMTYIKLCLDSQK